MGAFATASVGETSLPPEVGKALDDFVEAAKESFDERLLSIVLTGSAAENRYRCTSDVNLIVVLNEFLEADAASLAPALRVARALIHLDAVFILARELPYAQESFAHMFGDVLRRHRVLHGPDPFAEMQLNRVSEIVNLRHALMNLQLQMRHACVERAGQEDRMALLLADVAGPLGTCAAALSRLENQGTFPPKEALDRLVRSFGEVDYQGAIRDISAIRENQPAVSSATRALFLVCEIVDRMRLRAWSLE
jgi:predicted nucleotidyltransferase